MCDQVRLGLFRCCLHVRAMQDRWTRSLHRVVAGEGGQSSSEYLTMAGLVAAIILLLLGVIFVPQMRAAVSDLAEKLRKSVSGIRVR